MHPYPSVLHLSRIQRAHHTQSMPTLPAYSLVRTLRKGPSNLVSPIMTPSEEVPCASSSVMKFDDTLPEVPAPTEPTINGTAGG